MINLTMKFPQSVRFLNLSRNYVELPDWLSLCSDEKGQGLVDLDLSRNNLTFDGDTYVIAHCKNLTRVSLAHNFLTSSFVLELTDTDSLRVLDLAFNNIQKLKKRFIRKLDRHTNLQLNLSYNLLDWLCEAALLSSSRLLLILASCLLLSSASDSLPISKM